jgi:hypothetical protein
LLSVPLISQVYMYGLSQRISPWRPLDVKAEFCQVVLFVFYDLDRLSESPFSPKQGRIYG